MFKKLKIDGSIWKPLIRNGLWPDLSWFGGVSREQRFGEGSVDDERAFEKRLSRLARLTPEQKIRRWRKLEQM